MRQALSKDLNAVVAGPNLYDAERFKNIKLPVLIERAAAGGNLLSNNVIRLNRRMLEEAYPDDIVKSLGGVYPDTEILTASPDDSGQCFQEYMYDAQRRLQHDMQFPNEPHQVRSGEDVHLDESGRVQISGQVAVMAINGLLTKVIFDKNPDHEFYVEESFPLDWMYPHLVPFGIIMKINRQPVAELSEEVIAKDHAFWSQYSQRTIGNWITYDTSIKQICDWAEKVYLRHDFSDFKGDPAFIRDDDGQKAFSKLRSSIGSSIYRRPAGAPAVARGGRVRSQCADASDRRLFEIGRSGKERSGAPETGRGLALKFRAALQPGRHSNRSRQNNRGHRLAAKEPGGQRPGTRQKPQGNEPAPAPLRGPALCRLAPDAPIPIRLRLQTMK